MAVRSFNGTSDWISFPVLDVTGAFTIAGLTKRAANTPWMAVLGSHNGAGTSLLTVEMEGSATPRLQCDVNGSGAFSASQLASAASGWMIWAYSKAAGSSVVGEFSFYPLGTATWTQENGNNSIGNPPSQAGGSLRVGQFQGQDWFSGKMALLSIWNGTALSQAQVRALATNSRTSDWTGHAVAPSWVVEPGYGASTVNDLVGAGNSTAITGTTIVTNDDPAGWQFSIASQITKTGLGIIGP
jgi:hypothetical protein